MRGKPLDMSKFRKDQNKKLSIKDGFYDPLTWVSTGNYALNKMISGDFHGGIPIGSVTCFAGESGCLPASAHVTIRRQFDMPDGLTPSEPFAATVGELRQMVMRGEAVEIATPDGYLTIGAWHDKGVMPMVSIIMENGHFTGCAETHLLQTPDGEWIPAGQLTTDDELMTRDGPSGVGMVAPMDPAFCFDFEVDHPNQRYWGDGFSSHNSGKSYIVSGNIVRNALADGISVILLDSENAVKRRWAAALGVDTDHPNLIRWNKNTINQVAGVVSDFMKDYSAEFKDTPREDQPPVLFVIDSLGNLNSEAEIEQFSKAELKGDKGIKAKALKMLVTNSIRLFSGFQCGLVCTNHTYKSQDMYHPDDVISGGQAQIFGADIVVSINKNKLKEDELGNKITQVTGIRSTMKCVKTRYSKPFEEVEVHIPYSTGMNPYSGMFDLCKKWVLLKDGNRWRYTSKDGTEYKLYRKDMGPEFFDMIMAEWDDGQAVVAPIDVSEIEIEEETTNVE